MPMFEQKPYPNCPGCLLYSQPFYCQGSDQTGMLPCPGLGALSAFGNPLGGPAGPIGGPFGCSLSPWANMKPYGATDLMNQEQQFGSYPDVDVEAEVMRSNVCGELPATSSASLFPPFY